MRILTILALTLAGCAGETTDLDDCSDGATRTSDAVCGLNDRGTLGEVCTGGAWVQDACDDPDECEDGSDVTEDCWDARAQLDLTCTDGSWSPVTDCTLIAPINVSVHSDGTAANGASSEPAISPSGRWLSFTSQATNLVADDTNAAGDVFAHDIELQTTVLMSQSSEGVLADSWSGSSDINLLGQAAVFRSNATNLVEGDTNNYPDVFVRDLINDKTRRISENADGNSNGDSFDPQIADVENYVVFASNASNLVTDDTNGFADIFLYDMAAETMTRIVGEGSCSHPVISADGRYIAFNSEPTVRAPSYNYQVFLHDTTTSTTTKISVSSTGANADFPAEVQGISADGNYVIYKSAATNLVAGDTDTYQDVFVYDILAGTTTRESLDHAGNAFPDHANYASISGGGELITFASGGNDIVTGDTNNSWDMFLRDPSAGTTTALVTNASGTIVNGETYEAELSGNARHVAIGTSATDVVTTDSNGFADIFVLPTGH